jgi:hypothetical protein
MRRFLSARECTERRGFREDEDQVHVRIDFGMSLALTKVPDVRKERPMEWWMWLLIAVLVILIAAFLIMQNQQGGE